MRRSRRYSNPPADAWPADYNSAAFWYDPGSIASITLQDRPGRAGTYSRWTDGLADGSQPPRSEIARDPTPPSRFRHGAPYPSLRRVGGSSHADGLLSPRCPARACDGG